MGRNSKEQRSGDMVRGRCGTTLDSKTSSAECSNSDCQAWIVGWLKSHDEFTDRELQEAGRLLESLLHELRLDFREWGALSSKLDPVRDSPSSQLETPKKKDSVIHLSLMDEWSTHSFVCALKLNLPRLRSRYTAPQPLAVWRSSSGDSLWLSEGCSSTSELLGSEALVSTADVSATAGGNGIGRFTNTHAGTGLPPPATCTATDSGIEATLQKLVALCCLCRLACLETPVRTMRQTGHVTCFWSQESTQRMWKTCPQSGSLRNTSASPYSTKHMGHLQHHTKLS
jgi:hypothetical protein